MELLYNSFLQPYPYKLHGIGAVGSPVKANQSEIYLSLNRLIVDFAFFSVLPILTVSFALVVFEYLSISITAILYFCFMLA